MSPFIQRLIDMNHELACLAGTEAHVLRITLSERAWWAIVTQVEDMTPYPVQVDWSAHRQSDYVAAKGDCIRLCGTYRDTLIYREPRQGAKETLTFE